MARSMDSSSSASSPEEHFSQHSQHAQQQQQTHSNSSMTAMNVMPLVFIGANSYSLAILSRLSLCDRKNALVISSSSSRACGESSSSFLTSFAHRSSCMETLPLRESRNVHPFEKPSLFLEWAEALAKTKPKGTTVEDLNLFVSSTKELVPLATTSTYLQFTKDTISKSFPELENAIINDTVTSVTPIEDAKEKQALGIQTNGAAVRITMRSGNSIVARAAVHCAVRQAARIPEWATGALAAAATTVKPPNAGRLAHAKDVDIRTFGTKDDSSLRGKNVVVVGGGMAAAALCAAAARRGASVTLVHRGVLQRSEQEADVAFVGPKGRMQLRACGADYTKRLRLCLRARKHASLNRYAWKNLQSLIKSQSLEILQDTQVRAARWDGDGSDGEGVWQLDVVTNQPGDESNDAATSTTTTTGTLSAHHVWLATGRDLDVSSDPVLSKLTRSHPARIVGRLPVLSHGLAWPGVPLLVAGAAAALEIGPFAGLPQGQRLCADAVVSSLNLESEAFASAIAAPAGSLYLGDDEVDDLEALRLDAAPSPKLRDESRVSVDDIGSSLPRRPIDVFEWADDDGIHDIEVTLRLPEEPRMSRDRVRMQIRGERELELWVIGEKALWHFHVPRLYREVISVKSGFKVVTSACKIVVFLRKTSTMPWRFLKG